MLRCKFNLKKKLILYCTYLTVPTLSVRCNCTKNATWWCSDTGFWIKPECKPVGSTRNQLFYQIILRQLGDGAAEGDVSLPQDEANAVPDVPAQKLGTNQCPALNSLWISLKLKSKELINCYYLPGKKLSTSWVSLFTIDLRAKLGLQWKMAREMLWD